MSKPGQRVLAELRKLIASGELAAGERIVEIPTAERLQVSRMPVRIALRTLEQEGLLCKTGARLQGARGDPRGYRRRGRGTRRAGRPGGTAGGRARAVRRARATLEECLAEGDRCSPTARSCWRSWSATSA